MQYSVVFDVVTSGYRYWWFPATGLALALLVLVYASVDKKLPNFTRRKRVSSLFGVGFCLLWSIAAFATTFPDYLHLRNALQSGNCKIIEGVVTDFVPQAEGDHEPESFTVNGHRFSYSYATVAAGFNWTHPHGGPIHDGQKVRLAVAGDEIARAEVARDVE